MAETTTTRRRTARKAPATPSVPETDAPAPRKRTSSRKPPVAPAAEKAPAKAPASRRRATASVPAVEIPKERHVEDYTVDLTDPGVETERDFEKLLAKSPNENHENFVAWFQERADYELDIRSVQYTIATWLEFQRSPEQRERTQRRRAAAAERRALREASKR